jgi:hypothetical protein
MCQNSPLGYSLVPGTRSCSLIRSAPLITPQQMHALRQRFGGPYIRRDSDVNEDEDEAEKMRARRMVFPFFRGNVGSTSSLPPSFRFTSDFVR